MFSSPCKTASSHSLSALPSLICSSQLAASEVRIARQRVHARRGARFHQPRQRIVLEEFFVEILRTTFCETVDALQTDLDTWLVYYNTQRPHQGYRNMGRRPIDTVNLFLKPVSGEA